MLIFLVTLSLNPDEDKSRTNLFLGQEETLSTPPPKERRKPRVHRDAQIAPES